METVVFTIGHGNRSIEEFIARLREAQIACLVDVRAFPASRKHPQFGREPLGEALLQHGIAYRWEGGTLGGFRKARHDSLHIALESPGFRGYADHMQTPVFKVAVLGLLTLAGENRTAIMCAERLPWQCHRFFIADALVARGAEVVHLIGPGQTIFHALSPLARQVDEDLIYDRTAQLGLDLM